MTRGTSRALGIHPEIFNNIATPPIVSVETGLAEDGLPSYARLDVLIAYLTAPSSINYDTLSEFLMTFRMFATAHEVWFLLASRMLWAADQAARNGSNNETGADIGTRCFVFMRMWIRDYFAADFVPSLDLRLAAAESMTAFAGCTEFVLIDHFHQILVQLRTEWDTQISRFWVIPAGVAGNTDEPVPAGGDPVTGAVISSAHMRESKRRIADLGAAQILSGEVPIDADIAVPSIMASPPKRKPKSKLSLFFKKHRHEDDIHSKGEAVLHDKVDMLAMHLINEYHEFERRQMSPTYPSDAMQPAPAARMESTMPEPKRASNETLTAAHPSEQEHPHGFEREAEIFVTPDEMDNGLSDGDHHYDARVALDNVPDETATQQFAADAFSPEDFKADDFPREDSSGEAFKEEDLSRRDFNREDLSRDFSRSEFNGERFTLRDLTDIQHVDLQHVEQETALHGDDVSGTSGEEAGTASSSETRKRSARASTRAYYPVEADNVSEVSSSGSRTSMSTDDSLHEKFSTPTPSLYDEGWGTPRRSQSNGWDVHSESVVFEPSTYGEHERSAYEGSEARVRSGDSLPGAMTHEQSMDTLNMNHMGLANTSGDSEVDLDFNNIGLPSVETWGEVDYDKFDQVSYSGSSLSTLSTSTHSGFSYHAPVRMRSHHRQSIGTISLLSEEENSLLQPCAGYTPSDAERLKSMPDLRVDGDALMFTLQKLEGTSAPNMNSHGSITPGRMRSAALKTPTPTTIPRSSTLELYSQAFESPSQAPLQQAPHEPQEHLAHEVSQLGIMSNANHAPFQPPAPLLQSGFGDSIFGEPLPRPREYIEEPPHAESPRFAAKDDASQAGSEYAQFQRADNIELPRPLRRLHIGLPGSTHAPFVLAYSARAVAEQMTIIECQIASQLDIPGLIGMNWPQQTPHVNTWLQAVMEEAPLGGTALVTARSDLVRRWTQSEILLCPTPALQAQAISRFVHIAFEALRLQNFATMAQLVLGLCSQAVQSQLGEDVYGLLPQHDRETLGRLERLASPEQNYAKLMNAHKRFSWHKGCVPYTSMFLSDIQLTAEAASQNAEHEIHFGKYRIAAQLVKSLERCLDSGARYDIKPESALLSKCLYLAALPNL